MNICIFILICAFLLDLLIGDPVYSLHPIRLIGWVIRLYEKALRAIGLKGTGGGAILLIATVASACGIYLAIHYLLAQVSAILTMAFDLFTVYSCLALKDLLKHTRPVADALEEHDLASARTAVQKIVGRDAAVLDEYGIARATVESVSESFVDGFLSPVFWFTGCAAYAFFIGVDPLAVGAVAIIIFKSVSTLDSMVGYRNERYITFGRASARFDDLMNFIPARISIIMLLAAAGICGFKALRGLKTAYRFRLSHASPNSAHTESFVAGALGLKLGGPVRYPHGLVDKPWIGTGTTQAEALHIEKTCRLIYCAAWITLAAAILFMLLVTS